MNLEDRVLSVPEVARLLGVGVRTAYQAVHRGQIPALRMGRRIVVPGAALARLLEGGDEFKGSASVSPAVEHPADE